MSATMLQSSLVASPQRVNYKVCLVDFIMSAPDGAIVIETDVHKHCYKE